MDRPKILVTQTWPQKVIDALRDRFDVTERPDEKPLDMAELKQALNDYDGLCASIANPMPAEFFSGQEPRTRIIGNFGVGFSHIDVSAARDAGISVTNTPDVLSECTADLAITLMLMTARRAGEAERIVRDQRWQGWGPTQMLGLRATGKTLGVIGFGRIGQETARRAHFGFGMRVLGLKRSPISQEVLNTTGAEQADDLDHILREADFISLHCPGGQENRHLINAETIARMKPNAILVNTARGEVVDDDALIAALKDQKIAGAGLDVFDGEPDIHPGYHDLENAVLLPHIGSATWETREAMGMKVHDNLVAFFEGRTPPDLVN